MFGLPASELTDLKEPVATVIQRELKVLLQGKDLKEFNQEFLDKNADSLLYRLSGEEKCYSVLTLFFPGKT